MAGAFVGALAVLSMSMLFSWPVAVIGEQDPVRRAAAEAFDSPPGTCLDWPHDNPRNMRRVDCAQPHTFEVTSNVDISGELGSEAPPPDETAWQDIVTDKCTEAGAEYLGGKLDPFGKYTVGALKPTGEQWSDGDRTLRCGLQRVTPSGERLLSTSGAAAERDQSNVHEPGTCFGLVDGEVGDPVDCADEHSYEVVGAVDLSETFKPNKYPSEQDQGKELVKLCPPVADEYTGGTNLDKNDLSLYWDTVQKQSWEAGSYQVNCKVGARKKNGDLRPVMGSVAGDPPPPSDESSPPKSGG